jgi:hypothetical protein
MSEADAERERRDREREPPWIDRVLRLHSKVLSEARDQKKDET